VVLWAVVSLIAAGSLTALYALRLFASTTGELARERLERMQEAQDLVQQTLLVEGRLVRMMNASSPEDVRRDSAATVTELDALDDLVERLGAETADVEILALHESAQRFRNGVHVLAALRTEALEAGAGFPRQEALRRSRAELEHETLAMVASAQRLSGRFTSDYRDAVTGLAARSRAMAWWVLSFTLGGVIVAWLAFRYLLGRQVADRLQEVSRHLRLGVAGDERPHVAVRGGDEIAEMARAVEQLLSDRQRLAEANRELEGLSSSVSHELRAPIRHVEGFAQLLRERAAGALDERGRHYLDAISDAGRRMGAQIDGLLAFLRLRHAGMALTAVDLDALVREVVAELGSDSRERAIEWRIAPLPTVTGDRPMLRLALGALLSNAVKFSRSRPQPEIEVGSAPPTGEGDSVIFVRDNGVGFDMRYADKLFRVFHRLHNAEDFQGTGAGLAIVRRVVERHGGRTWAEGTPGKGATFFLSLPIGRRAADAKLESVGAR
jgi:signal transduction histidine kinase